MSETFDVQTEARTRLEAGESVPEILRSYPVIEDREKAFEALATIPAPGAFDACQWENRILIAVFLFIVGTYSVGLLDAVFLNQYIAETLIGVLGNCVVVFGLIKRRPWIYVGIPFWVALMVYGELRALAGAGELEDPFLIGYLVFFLVLYAISVWLAVGIRRSVFPLLTWRGLPRSASGTLRLPTWAVEPPEE